MTDRPLNDLTYAELLEWLGDGTEPNEARKIFAAVHAAGCSERLDRRPDNVRRRVLDRAAEGLVGRLSVADRRQAEDGFVKYLFQSPLGGEFEAVRIPLFERKHVVCVSSQIGCALGCAFCATGRMGFSRNLETWEMVEQVRRVADQASLPVRHVVFMGMGEPLLNYERVMRAARILGEPGGLQVGSRNITLSTAGVVPAIRRYAREGLDHRLAFSVTSAIPEKRALLMPIERTHPLPGLVEAIREYARLRRERAMIAYVMIAGYNTGREDARALAAALAGIPVKIDLIDVADPTGTFRPPDAGELAAFRDALQAVGAPIARRYSGGLEIHAACGTLAATRAGGRVIPGPQGC